MDNQKIAKQFLSAIEKNDFNKAESLLAADFKFTGITSEPLDMKESIRLYKAFAKSFPDFKFNPKFINEHGEYVELIISLTGNQQEDMPGELKMFKSLPHYIALSEEKVEIIVDKGKIESMNFHVVKDEGIVGLLKKMGFLTPLDEKYP